MKPSGKTKAVAVEPAEPYDRPRVRGIGGNGLCCRARALINP